MYFEDLTTYSYYLPCSVNEVLNIGWLDNNHDFPRGNVPKGFCKKLFDIFRGTDSFISQVNIIRGVHPCNFCGRQQSDLLNGLGRSEIWIPYGENTFFASPSQIIHYIEKHHYMPPINFINAAMNVSLTDDFNGQDVYDSLINKYALQMK